MLELITITMPASWAPYIITGEASGLSEEEIREADAALRDLWEQGIEIVDVAGEPYFSWSPDYGEPGDVLDYIGVIR